LKTTKEPSSTIVNFRKGPGLPSSCLLSDAV
jgi:hypothetical protein